MARLTTLLMLITWLILVGACATSPQPKTEIPDARQTTRPVPDTGARIARAALNAVGTPYRYGGADENGFDCSGLVQYVHLQVGISIPRTAATQFRAARQNAKRLQIGDVLFFRIGGSLSHNGIYIGNGKFVHAPSSGKQVSVARTDNPYFRKRLVGVRRFH